MKIKSKKLRDWQEKNKWFGKNEHKTTHALIAHDLLIMAGINPKTIRYLKLIDYYMDALNYHRLDRKTK